MAKDMGCLIPEPLCVGDFKGDSSRGRRLPDNVLLDDLREHYDRMKKQWD